MLIKPPANPLVLLSGGLDSATALYLTGARHALWVNYGQRHVVEYNSAWAIAQELGVKLSTLNLLAYGESVKSALTSSDQAVPHGHYAEDNMSQTVVPNRNAVLLSAAAGIASSKGLTSVVTAVHSGDHPVYRDCRPDFIQALSHATQLACDVTITAPFMFASKADIVKLGADMKVPYRLTWSCYEGGEIHCGRCGTCVERAEAFHLAGVDDPTVYADPTFWREATGS